VRLPLALACIGGLALAPIAAHVRPKAELSPQSPAAAARPGTRATLVLDVRLPDDVHVQSDAPRDPTLIATALTITPPDGVTVERIRYPKPTDLPQPGRREPLAVFGSTFEIAVDVRVAASVAAGSLAIPARLRYQVCDATTCFAPARAEASWTLAVADSPAP
jgi:DsbC/DsbD-like thiol-disulfide interchange protein